MDSAGGRRLSGLARVIELGDLLPPHFERLAWKSVLGTDPPLGWPPCGAAVADFASALTRYRILGRTDARSLADFVLRVRDARLGPRRRLTHSHRKGPVR